MTPTESVRLLGRSFLFLKDKAGKLNMDVTKVLLVLLGGAVGTGCRYWLSTFVYSVVEKPSFPYANFIINVSGSLIIGILAELFVNLRRAGAHDPTGAPKVHSSSTRSRLLRPVLPPASSHWRIAAPQMRGSGPM